MCKVGNIDLQPEKLYSWCHCSSQDTMSTCTSYFTDYVYLLKDVFKEEIDIEHSLLSPTKIFFILKEYGYRVINDIQNDTILPDETRDTVRKLIPAKKKIIKSISLLEKKYWIMDEHHFSNVMLYGWTSRQHWDGDHLKGPHLNSV